MRVLSGIERDKIIEVMEFIIKNQNVPVIDIKKRFKLSNEEYEMCMDLAMPAICYHSGMTFYKQSFRKVYLSVQSVMNYINKNPKNLAGNNLIAEIKNRLQDVINDSESRWTKREFINKELDEPA